MQTTSKKSNETKVRKEKKDESKKDKDEKFKKSLYTISTPREYVTKTTTGDIYAQKKNVVKAPRKVAGVSTTSNVSPMQGLLKSSASSTSQISRISHRTPPKKLEPKSLYSTRSDAKTTHSATKSEKSKKVLTNVTVNSPVVKRKFDLNIERVTKEVLKEKVSKSKEVGNAEPRSKEVKAKEVSSGEPRRSKETIKAENVGTKEKGERQRTKTRTLDESEVKILIPDNVDNNAEMRNLSKKLVAKPKAFYVDLDEEKPKSLPKKQISDDEVSYEDDFESYESDFDSYHSDSSKLKSESSGSESELISDERGEQSETNEPSASSVKERDEERMLDSGNFELRDPRSAKTKPEVMDFILEVTEKSLLEDKKSVEEYKKSLDEGFLDMSSSASSMRTVDILDRPLFIDFSKSKLNKVKRTVIERLKQRATDLLSMITLHEMTYSLYEMQPISYDLYMATFGRSNYTQSGVQTFDDGITEEVQTDEVSVTQKWTQCPVEFSKNYIHLPMNAMARKYSRHTEDYLTKFTFLIKDNYDQQNDCEMKSDENYKDNPLRVFLEQKDGVGGDEMLPYETYKSKLKSNDYSSKRLSKFLKRFESKVSSILSKNTGAKDLAGLEKSGKLSFTKGHVAISPKSIENSKYFFLKSSKITKVIFSETKSNLMMTVHKKAKGVDGKKCLVCLWDLSVAREPRKTLLVIDDIAVGRFRGNTDGIFVAALEDGSIHLWDLSEEPSWRDDVASGRKSAEIVEVEDTTQVEKDREWNNLRNTNVGFPQLAIVYTPNGARICFKSQSARNTHSNVTLESINEGVGYHSPDIPFALQSCAYTNSALNMSGSACSDCIVGLEMMASQIVSLQRIGILTIWSIVQEKKASKDIGKAFWSRMKLEKHQTINISEHIDGALKENNNFNLNSAKRRITLRKQEKNLLKTESPRPKTASKSEFDFDRPYSAASLRKKVLPVETNLPKSWENGIVCNDLKIVFLNSVHSFLVAKNCGEVICCKRCLGVVKIERFSVATDRSSITCLDVSSEGTPYFLAASDSGTVSLCSLLDTRVLLILDSRNIPPSLDAVDKCQSDNKGRFVSSVAKPICNDAVLSKIDIKSIHWSRENRCCIFVLLRNETLILFDLTHSDINARSASDKTACYAAMSDHNLALITSEDVQVHRLTDEERNKEYLDLFNKYVALL